MPGAWRCPFEEAINQACWDLAAKQAGLPLYRLLGGTNGRVRTYASGLDYHLSDAQYVEFFRRPRRWATAASRSRSAIPTWSGTCTG